MWSVLYCLCDAGRFSAFKDLYRNAAVVVEKECGTQVRWTRSFSGRPSNFFLMKIFNIVKARHTAHGIVFRDQHVRQRREA
jgi:hypothetical protein